jgi:two-component system sensor histidine kinase CreC
LTRSVEKLRDYAKEVSLGRRAILPKLAGGELAELGRALETMREKLEGRRYVERYVHTLTHELKSPLSAIHGAAELLQEDMPEADRQRFLSNIREQEERLQRLIQRMLDLASVEQRQGLQQPARVSLAALVEGVLESLHPRLALRNLKTEISIPAEAQVQGEFFLLEQALSNLLDNAMEFSEPGGTIQISTEASAGFHTLVIRDAGPGIPDYALEKIFDPFYSLPRPDTGKKSTGLGLSFVRQVAELHGGSIQVGNVQGGCEARLALPRA